MARLSTRFSTADPDLLKRDLEGLVKDLEDRFTQVDRTTAKKLTSSRSVSNATSVQLLFGEVLRVSPSAATVAYLPRAKPADAGLQTALARVSGSSAVTVIPVNCTINGASSWSAPTNSGLVLFHFDGENWYTTGDRGTTELPIGIVLNFVVGTDPADLLGYGTWQVVGTGRVLIGQDASDADFDTLEETGGSKTHTHNHSHTHDHDHVHSGPEHNHTGGSHSHDLTLGLSAGYLWIESLPGGSAGSARIGYVTYTSTVSGPAYTLFATKSANVTTGNGGTGDTGSANPTATDGASTATTENNSAIPMKYYIVKRWKRTA